MIDPDKFEYKIESHLTWDHNKNTMVEKGWAYCKVCGERHYVIDGHLRINGKTVSECITCAYRNRGAKLW